ncbi:hypothetical protein [Agathobaculum butyriciproducens]|uniref:hypothetical protein n=1 Tax=Agathobaculum butyriciproducens TaxID=1628085 RepID=UPI0036D24373
MQHQISQLDGIDDCVLVYETKQLRVKGDNPDALLPEIRKICSNIESEVKVIAPPRRKRKRAAAIRLPKCSSVQHCSLPVCSFRPWLSSWCCSSRLTCCSAAMSC